MAVYVLHTIRSWFFLRTALCCAFDVFGFPRESEVISMSVYEALSLMIAFATLVVLIISIRK